MKLQKKQEGFTLLRLRASEGFTLIEMMVVIAVIGILSAAVLAGLGPSRNKARDARVMSGLNQIRTLAETVYNPIDANPYSGLSAAAASVVADIQSQGTTVTIDTATEFQFYASAALPSDSSKVFCVDSSGYAGLQSRAPSDTPCSGATPGSNDNDPPTGLAAGESCTPPAAGASNPCATGSCVEGVITGIGTCQ